MATRKLLLILDDIRSAHNVGSILRTADGLGVNKVYLAGYTPYPSVAGDSRLPHVAQRAAREIAKTALGAEKTVSWQHVNNTEMLLNRLRRRNFFIAALEQSKGSILLPDFKTKLDLALVVGNEVKGIDPGILAYADIRLEIPMKGTKESFNVSAAAAIALYHIVYQA